MKKLLIFVIIALGTNIAFAQKQTIQVEQIIKQDSLKTVLYSCITEGCQKAKVNMRVEGQSCPVFIDEEGYMFFIKIDNGDIAIVEIDMD